MKAYELFFVILVVLYSCKKENNPVEKEISIDYVRVNNISVSNNATINDVEFKRLEMQIGFTSKVDTTLFDKSKFVFADGLTYFYKFSNSGDALFIRTPQPLIPFKSYRFFIDQGKNLGGTIFNSFAFNIFTRLDSTPKFPVITDDSLLTLVQKQTFRFFWDHAHPVSGLARDRFGSAEIVTSGGSGFGIMSILVGINRGFISRQQGFERIEKIVNFLNSSADKFHGTFPHWLNGNTGKTIAFTTKDNGGDLVETAFLLQGLLSAMEYFKNGSVPEKAVCDTIQKIWTNVEWNWYRKNDQNQLYWHWSPTYNWDMNMPVRGWNEALMVYVLAASAPVYSIPETVYTNGWARNGAYPMVNGKIFFNIRLPLGEDYGGPLFFAHYSFLGLDPRNLSDRYADYEMQNIAHTLINYEYCKANPKKYRGYSENCWGLTASDIQSGYSASSPANDLGVIAPTAALSSFPYTPAESMKALKFFYYTMGDKLWGEYGFYDAFNLSTGWFAHSYLAIDQGPIVCMIENYRTGFLWNLFMANPDVKTGLIKLGFTY